MFYVLIFLASIVLANLSVSYFGPASMPINAFILIGLDLSLRDKLHESWHGKDLKWKMFCLVFVSGLITYVLNQGAGRIAFASVTAFTVAMVVDVIIYQLLFKTKKLVKMNVSNIGSAVTDSILFPTLAFGSIMPFIVLQMFLAKVVGGALWAWILTRRLK